MRRFSLRALAGLMLTVVILPACAGSDLPDPATAEHAFRAQLFGPKGASFQITNFRKTNGQTSEMNSVKFYALDFSADVNVLEDVTYQNDSRTIQVFERGAAVGEALSKGDRFQLLGTVRYERKEKGWVWLSSNSVTFQLWKVEKLPGR